MSDLIENLLRKQLNMSAEQILEARAQAKKDAEDQANGKKRPVGKGHEFKRISGIPARPWDYFQSDDFVDAATNALKTPEGTMRLRPVQAAALIEAQRCDGLVGLMGVGSGKALVSMLLPTVMNSKRCVLLVPSSLVEQTHRVYNAMREHWQVMEPENFHIVSFSTLSSTLPKKARILEELDPDLLVVDEASGFKNKNATRTGRVLYRLRNKPTRLALLSGTLTSRSLKDCQHLVYYVLRDRSPIPEHFPTLTEWCEALDSDVDEDQRRPAGAILDFSDKNAPRSEEPKSPLMLARDAFRHRMISTPGVVATAATQLGTSLVIGRRELVLPASITAAMADLRKNWARPDGETFSDILEFASMERELSCGFWNKWMWPNDIVDEEWLEARRNWNKAVREKLRHSGPGADSPALLYNAAKRAYQHERGEKNFDDRLPRWKTPFFEAWLKVRDRPVPETQAQWIDDRFMIDDAIRWGNERDSRGTLLGGIIWFSHVAVGEKIAARGGFPYYGDAESLKKNEKSILDEKGDRTIVVSLNAHSEGKNLQHAFWRNLYTTPPASGKLAEQSLGRTHREFQPRDTVYADFYLHTDSFKNAFRSALRDAQYMTPMLGPQKLDYGTKTFDLDA